MQGMFEEQQTSTGSGTESSKSHSQRGSGETDHVKLVEA